MGKGLTLMALRKGSLLRIPTKDQSYDVPAPSESNLLDVMDTHTKKEKENTLFGGRCVWCLIKTGKFDDHAIWLVVFGSS